MVLPRLTLKRVFFYVVCLTGTLLVFINVRQKDIWHNLRAEPAQTTRSLDSVKVSFFFIFFIIIVCEQTHLKININYILGYCSFLNFSHLSLSIFLYDQDHLYFQ